MTGFAAPDAGRSIAQHLGLTMREVDVPGTETTGIDGTAPAPAESRAPGGEMAAGALLTMLDSVGGLCGGLAVLPGWVVSTNLMMSTARFDHVGPFALTARVLRAGRAAVITRVEIADAGRDGVLVAEGVLTSAVLRPAEGPPVYPRPLVLAAPAADPAAAPALPDFIGVRAVDATTVEIAVAEHLRNPWGILHGGATAALVDAAATHAAGAGYRTADVVLHFLAPARVGPVAARATVVGDRTDGLVVEVAVTDRGADGRSVALAIVTVHPIAGPGA